MKRDIEKTRKTFRSAAEVMETIRNVWVLLSVDEINGLYKSLPERLKEVINMCGHHRSTGIPVPVPVPVPEQHFCSGSGSGEHF